MTALQKIEFGAANWAPLDVGIGLPQADWEQAGKQCRVVKFVRKSCSRRAF